MLKEETYIERSGQGVYDLICSYVIVDEDLGAMLGRTLVDCLCHWYPMDLQA